MRSGIFALCCMLALVGFPLVTDAPWARAAEDDQCVLAIVPDPEATDRQNSSILASRLQVALRSTHPGKLRFVDVSTLGTALPQPQAQGRPLGLHCVVSVRVAGVMVSNNETPRERSLDYTAGYRGVPNADYVAQQQRVASAEQKFMQGVRSFCARWGTSEGETRAVMLGEASQVTWQFGLMKGRDDAEMVLISFEFGALCGLRNKYTSAQRQLDALPQQSQEAVMEKWQYAIVTAKREARIGGIIKAVDPRSGEVITTLDLSQSHSATDTYTRNANPDIGIQQDDLELPSESELVGELLDKVVRSAASQIGARVIAHAARHPLDRAPQIEWLGPRQGSRVSGPSVRLQARLRDDTGLASASLNESGIKGVAGTNYEIDDTVELEEGPQAITLTCTDQTGQQTSYTATFVVDCAPKIAIHAPTEGEVVASPELTLRASVTDRSGVVSVRVNGQTAVACANPEESVEVAYDMTLANVGDNVIIIQGTDAGGRTSTATRGIRWDEPPTLIVGEPEEGATVLEPTVLVRGRATDDVGLASLAIGDAEIPVTDPQQMIFSHSADLVPGMNTITVKATDLAGNVVEKKTLVIADLPPRVSVEVPEGWQHGQASVRLEGTVFSYSGLSVVNVGGQRTALQGQREFSFDQMVAVAEGESLVKIFAKDVRERLTEHRVDLTEANAPALGPVIAQVDGNQAYLNIGADDGVNPGAIYVVVAEQEVRDPGTGLVIQRVHREIARIEITDVWEKVSLAKLLSCEPGTQLKAGLAVRPLVADGDPN